jgi:hypothetical protein
MSKHGEVQVKPIKPRFKFGMKRILLNTLVVAIVIASAQFSAVMLLCMLILGWLTAMAMLVIACSAKRPLKTFAIGFSVPVVCYAIAWAYFGKDEVNVYNAFMPTTLLFFEVIGSSMPHLQFQILKWHMLFALGSGYLGGHLAQWTRTAENSKTQPS